MATKAGSPPGLFFALPGSIETRTGGTIYDKQLVKGLRELGWTIDLAEWPRGFPFPRYADRQIAEASLAARPDGTIAVIDGLAYGVLGKEVARHADRLRLVALVHHPLALESGLAAQAQADFIRAERHALESATAIIVTSRTTADCLVQDYAVPPGRITVAHPGIDPAGVMPPADRPADAPPVLLAVGTVSVRKGYDLLVEALARLADLSWTCRIAGSLERVPEAVFALRNRIIETGLADRIQLLGEVAAMPPLYAAADLFVLPSRHEGYGMAFAEALRHGLPVIGCHTGAVPEVVPADAGILVAPDDIDALTAALRSLITDAGRRAGLAAAARDAGRALPGWTDTACLVSNALRRL